MRGFWGASGLAGRVLRGAAPLPSPAQPRTSRCRHGGAPPPERGQPGEGDEEEGDAAGRKGRGLGGGEEGGGCKTWGWGAGPREAKATEVTTRGQRGARAGGCSLGSDLGSVPQS